MINFEFNKYVSKFLDNNMMNSLLNRKQDVMNKFKNSEMTGWTREFNRYLVKDILDTRDYIRKNSDCLVVVGIGGSFLGSYALKKMFSKYFDKGFDIIYAGTTLSGEYLSELLEYLEDKNFTLNVISKSGTTMETSFTYNAIMELMNKKYSKDEIRDRLIIVTDQFKGKLREEININNYKSFIIPSDIGGRYSLFTAAHLLPLSFYLDIDLLLDGFFEGLNLVDDAYNYACIRRCLYSSNKLVENYCVYEEKLLAYTEWLKQLFGETEGKNNTGIYPSSCLFTRDLHSLGQFIQEGTPILFETVIKVLNNKDLYINNSSLNDINNTVLDSVVQAHYSGGVPCNIITIDKIDEENIGKLCAFFMLSAAYSGFLFDVDPFNQPGVEVYKKFVRENL